MFFMSFKDLTSRIKRISTVDQLIYTSENCGNNKPDHIKLLYLYNDKKKLKSKFHDVSQTTICSLILEIRF